MKMAANVVMMATARIAVQTLGCLVLSVRANDLRKQPSDTQDRKCPASDIFVIPRKNSQEAVQYLGPCCRRTWALSSSKWLI